MAIVVGTVVRFRNPEPGATAGRVCRIFGLRDCCVQFPDDCLMVPIDALVAAPGDTAPPCSSQCSGGCAG